MDDQIQKSVKVLTRIKDYFLEAIDKYSKTVGDATKTLQDSLKRIEKDLKTIEMGSLPTSEKAASTAVIATVLAKRGEVMSTQDLWTALSGKIPVPEQAPAATQAAEEPVMFEATTAPSAGPPKAGPPSAVPSGPPKAESELMPEIPFSGPPSAEQAFESEEITEKVPMQPMAQVPVAMAPTTGLTEEKPTVGSLKSEMLKELKRLKKLMTGIT